MRARRNSSHSYAKRNIIAPHLGAEYDIPRKITPSIALTKYDNLATDGALQPNQHTSRNPPEGGLDNVIRKHR